MRRSLMLVVAGAALAVGALTPGAPAVAGAPAGGSTTAVAAPAAPSTSGVDISISAVRSARSAGDAATAAVITCTMNTQYPHKSTHVPGTVNVVTVVTCTAPVPQINIRAALYRNGTLVKDSGQKAVYNSSSAQNNAAVTCSNGSYQGWGSFGVLFPPGYVPQTGTGSDWGSVASITC